VAEDAAGTVCGYVYASKTRNAPLTSGRSTPPSTCATTCAARVGRALYDRLLPLLAELGYCQAFAGVALPNVGSVGLHEALGFQPIGVYRNVGFKHGAWRDVGWWQRSLRETEAPPGPPAVFDSRS
jgi:phosphinothricin acetyltransferase